MNADYKYFAFISYSRKDSRAAAYLHRSLEHFRIPTRYVAPENRPSASKFIRPVFRDKRDLANTEGSFTEDIRTALLRTRYLLVICSCNAVESRWVNEEITFFLENNGNDWSRVIPIVLNGNPGSGDGTECLPAVLRCSAITERNLPTMVPDEGVKESDGWENGVIQTLSYVLKVNREKIKASIDAERVRQMKIYAAIGIVCTCIFAGLAFWAVKAERRADVNRKIAEANETRAVAGEREAIRQREKAEANERRAVAGEKLADEKRQLVEKTLTFVKNMLQEGKPDEHGPKNVVDLLSEQISKVDLLTPDELRYSVASLLGSIMHEQSMTGPAERLLSGAVNYYRRQKDENKFNDCANSLSVLLMETGREREALALQEEMDRTSTMTDYEPIIHVRHLRNIGITYFNLGDMESAFKYFKLAKEKLPNNECREGAFLLMDEAHYYETKGDYRTAETLSKQAMALHAKVTGQENYTFIEQCGRNCYQCGKYTEARQYIERVVVLLQNRGMAKSSGMALAQNTLGLINDAEGKTSESITCYEKAIAILEGMEHRNDGLLVNLYSNLGKAFTQLGNKMRARHLLEKAIVVGEKKYGPNSENLFFALMNLGFIEMSEERYPQAIAHLNRAEDVIVRKHGRNHSNLILVYNNRATMNVNRGEHMVALVNGGEALRLCETNQLVETGMGAIALSNLAQANECLGNHDRAVAQITRAREIARKVMRVNDPERRNCEITYEGIVNGFKDKGTMEILTLDKQTVMATAKQALYERRYDEARKLYRQLLDLLRQRGEEMTADHALALNQLGVIAADLDKDYRSAFAYYRKAIEVGEQLFGAGAPELSTFYSNAGNCLDTDGDNRGAVDYYRKGLGACQSATPPDQKQISLLYTKLARAYGKSGSLSNAVESCRAALACDLGTCGTNSVEAAIDYEDLADLMLKQQAHASAAENYERALHIRKGLAESNPRKLAYLINGIGVAWYRAGKYARALDWHRQAYHQDCELYGLTNRETVVALANIGDCENKCGDVTNAVHHLRLAMELKMKIPDFTDKDRALAYNNLGIAYDDAGDRERALDCYRQALAIDIRLYGRQHREVMVVYGNMAISYRGQNRTKEESSCLRKALDIALVLDDGSRKAGNEVLVRYQNMVNCLSRQKEFDRCAEFRKRMIELVERINGANSPKVAAACNLCGNAYWNAGNHTAAQPYYQRALDLYRRHGTNETPNVAIVAGNLGRNEIELGKYKEALETLTLALDICRRSPDLNQEVAEMEKHIANCRVWQTSVPVVKITKIGKGDMAEKLGLSTNDVWYGIGQWKLTDFTRGKDQFWRQAQDEWERLQATNRTFSVCRQVSNRWERLSFNLDSTTLDFNYGLWPMPKKQFEQLMQQSTSGK